MKSILTGAVAALGLMLASAGTAQTLKLKPASPQPSSVKPGLSVKYAWGGRPPAAINNLKMARKLLQKEAEPGQPLKGLDYRDTDKGDPVMTHPQHYNVAADIRGYIRFDAPGVYELETWSNDGIDARVSGQQIGFVRGRQPCEANQRVTVEVPKAGWYDLSILYYQKYGTSCLMMKWGKQGEKMKWVPNGAFGR